MKTYTDIQEKNKYVNQLSEYEKEVSGIPVMGYSRNQFPSIYGDGDMNQLMVIIYFKIYTITKYHKNFFSIIEKKCHTKVMYPYKINS